jgi:hypothetical protein
MGPGDLFPDIRCPLGRDSVKLASEQFRKDVAMRKLGNLWVVGIAAFLLAATGIAQDAPKKAITQANPPLKTSVAKSRPNTYGTAAASYYRISASEFTGMEVPGADSWTDVWYGTTGELYRRYGQVTNAYFIATPHLPSGAKLVYLELDDCGGTPTTVHLDLFLCDYMGDCGAGPVQTINAVPGCGADFADISGLGLVVDNLNNQFLARVVTDAADGSNSFAGVIFGYQLQVSPAPPVATFLDVPTSDGAFQYVEALVAADITAGCGGGNYCPDSPVTRRQMAVFIAKALGLHFQ